MYKNLIYAIGIFFLFAAGCSSEEGANDSNSQAPVTVVEVVQTSNYTYLKVDEAGEEKWMAVTRRDAKAGDEYYYTDAMLMEDFESKELERTFEKILFVDNISSEPVSTSEADSHAEQDHAMQNPHGGEDMESVVSKQSGKHQAVKTDVNIELPQGAVSIAELYKNKADYEGKKVKVSGVVTKFSPAIMDRNWVHLQDGTEHEGEFDLTVTTLEAVEEGDTVIMEGTLSVDKDFGYGYFYKILLEDSGLK